MWGVIPIGNREFGRVRTTVGRVYGYRRETNVGKLWEANLSYSQYIHICIYQTYIGLYLFVIDAMTVKVTQNEAFPV